MKKKIPLGLLLYIVSHIIIGNYNCLYAQDRKLINITSYPLVLPISPALEGGLSYSYGFQSLVNLTDYISIGFKYNQTTYKDQYNPSIISNLGLQPDTIIIDISNVLFSREIDDNIEYDVKTFSGVVQLNLLPSSLFNPYISLNFSGIRRKTNITAFNSSSLLNQQEYLVSLQNAQKGYDFISTGNNISDSDLAIDIPFKEDETIFSAGLSLGVEWNISRSVSAGLQFSSPDLFKALTFPNTNNVIFIKYSNIPEHIEALERVEFPNPEEDLAFKTNPDNNTVGYLMQSMDMSKDMPMIWVEFSLTYKVIFKKY